MSLGMRRYILPFLAAIVIIAGVVLLFDRSSNPAQPDAEAAMRSSSDVPLASAASILPTDRPTAIVPADQPTADAPTPVPPTAQPTLAPATATAIPTLEPTAQQINPRVGVQVGHWKSDELPEELANLRGNTGAHAAGVSEVEVNMLVAQRVVALLQARGIEVDLLPATVPPGYKADAFVSIHADGAQSTEPRGFKMATPWRTSRAAQHLLDALMAEYGTTTGLPQDDNITMNMRGYYAFSWRRHEHAVAKTTPAVIVEMGYLTNPRDRAFLLERSDTAAIGVANGILRYLNERDVSDLAALEPPDFPAQRPIASGVTVRAAPRDDGRVLAQVTSEQRLMPFQERDGWFQVFVRGSGGVVGWVRRDQVEPTNERLPLPTGNS